MKRNKFNLSHYKIGSCDMGQLIPISCYEVLPGDTIRQGTNVFLRFAPMLSPVMHPIRISTYTFYCPTRLLWDKFEDFITGGPDGLDTSTPPECDSTNSPITRGTILDYLGVPVGYAGKMSELPLRAYFRIWNEYFRDQDLQVENSLYGTNTSDNGYTFTSGSPIPQMVSWEKDYFTTCRPWPQKGAEVSVPVNGLSGSQSITISGNGSPRFSINNTPDSNYPYAGTGVQQRGILPSADPSSFEGKVALQGQLTNDAGNNLFRDLNWDDPKLQATLNNSSTGIGNVRLDDLREAFALQRFEEARAMYGSRYTEYLRYLGVKSSDARLQRPEYLGGSRSTMQISEVLQTADDGGTPVGTLRGHGIGATSGRRFRRFIEEHGYVMTLLVIRPIALYSQGLNKMWSRQVKEDYWQKELQHIGQQEVLNKELYAFGDDQDGIFGYQNRYDDYRSVPSTISGEMRDVLDYWHMARNFANKPVLNESFITGSPTKRIFAEQTYNEVYFMASNAVVVRRLMSKTGNPIM